MNIKDLKFKCQVTHKERDTIKELLTRLDCVLPNDEDYFPFLYFEGTILTWDGVMETKSFNRNPSPLELPWDIIDKLEDIVNTPKLYCFEDLTTIDKEWQYLCPATQARMLEQDPEKIELLSTTGKWVLGNNRFTRGGPPSPHHVYRLRKEPKMRPMTSKEKFGVLKTVSVSRVSGGGPVVKWDELDICHMTRYFNQDDQTWYNFETEVD